MSSIFNGVKYPPPGSVRTLATFPVSTTVRTTSADTTFCITAELMRLETETVGGDLDYDIALVLKGIALPSANPKGKRDSFGSTTNQAASQSARVSLFMDEANSALILHLADTILGKSQTDILKLDLSNEVIPSKIANKIKRVALAAGSGLSCRMAYSQDPEDVYPPNICAISPDHWLELNTGVSRTLTYQKSFINVPASIATMSSKVYDTLRGSETMSKPRIRVLWQQEEGTLCQFTGLRDGKTQIADLIGEVKPHPKQDGGDSEFNQE